MNPRTFKKLLKSVDEVRKMKHSYEIIQDGIVVVLVEASKDKQARQEIGHYAMLYSQDGPIKVRKIRPIQKLRRKK